MIDTISFTTNARFKPWLGDFTSLPIDWFASACGRLSNDLNTQSMALICKPIDLRIYRQGPTVTSVCVNLPKLLFGHNGRLIENKGQFELGMQWLDWILRQVLEPNWPNDGFIPGYTQSTPDGHFTRIDLAWQFPAAFGLRSALEFARHPKIRSHSSNIRGQTVELRGTLLSIKVYDKLRQMLKIVKSNQPAIDRWEVGLLAKGLAEVYQTHDGLGYSQINWLWVEHTIRKIAAELECTVAPVSKIGIASFLAHLQHRFPNASVVEDYIRIKPVKGQAASRVRRQVADYGAQHSSALAFADLFPSNGTPPLHEIQIPDLEREHAGWLSYQKSELLRINAK